MKHFVAEYTAIPSASAGPFVVTSERSLYLVRDRREDIYLTPVVLSEGYDIYVKEGLTVWD